MPLVCRWRRLCHVGAGLHRCIQFAAVSVVDTGGSGVAAVGSALLLAARTRSTGRSSLAFCLRRGFRASSAQFVIDETTAMASVQETDVDARDAFWWTAIWLWSFGTSDRSAVRFSARSSERRRRGVLMRRSRRPSSPCSRRISEKGRSGRRCGRSCACGCVHADRTRRCPAPRGGTCRDPGLAGRAREAAA